MLGLHWRSRSPFARPITALDSSLSQPLAALLKAIEQSLQIARGKARRIRKEKWTEKRPHDGLAQRFSWNEISSEKMKNLRE